MKRNFSKRVSNNLKSFREDLKVLQRQITKQSVYKRPYAYAYDKQYAKHKKKLFEDFYEGGKYNEMSIRW
jgi:hypothetical protein